MIYILHISDLHFVQNTAFHNMEKILLREAKEKVKNVPQGQKLLIVTGDFHNFLDRDYAKAEFFLKCLVDDMGLDMKEDVFVVPGNHDVGNDDILKPLKEEDANWKMHQKADVNMLKRGDMSFIPDRLLAFRAYSEFVYGLGINAHAKNPDYPAATHVRNWRGKLNILHLNTALVADGRIKNDQITDTYTAADPETWKDFNSENIPSIVIGHNSYYDLKSKCRKELATTFLLRNVRAYLAGDTHQTEYDLERQMIRLESGFRKGEEIPNLVAARGIDDGNDDYSEVGFCWHTWDEDTDKVTVEFRKLTPNALGTSVPDGNRSIYNLSSYNKKGIMEPYIFLNYAFKDSEIVNPIIDELQKNGYRMWINYDLLPGSNWTDDIAKKLSGSSVILSFITKSFCDSPSCLQELYFAKRERKRIIPIILDGLSFTDLPPDLRFLIGDIQCGHMDTKENISSIVYKLNQIPFLQIARSMTYRQNNDESSSHYEFTSLKADLGMKSKAQECKVIFLGDADAGKSSLIERIIHDRFEAGSLPTDGLKMSKWETELEGSPFVLRFLDFGGQEILHSMHRCFLTSHTVYVVVCESRNDTEIDGVATRWLETVKAFAPECPVILALNKADLNTSVSVNTKNLKTVNPRLVSVLRTSAAVEREEKYGVNVLLDAIWQEIPKCINRYEADTDMMGVKRELENMKEDYIDATKYKTICEQYGIKDSTVQRSLLNWFKELGVAYYYEPEKLDTLVSSVRVLNPAWLSNGIYRLILRTPETGFLSHQEIKETLQAKHPKDVMPNVVYMPEETEYILHVMEMFELSLELENGMEMIPAKMSKTPPDKADQFPKENALHLQWKGAYLPNNLIHRLMIRKFPELDTRCVWRTGGRFEKADTQCTALAEMNDQTLDVYVTGEKNMRKYFMESFRDEIRMIMGGMGIAAEETICYSIDGKEGHIPYDAAMDALEQGKKEIPLYDIKKYISPKKLINDVFTDEEKERTHYRQEKGDFSRFNHFTAGLERVFNIFLKISAIVIGVLVVLGIIHIANPDLIKSILDFLKSIL